MPRQTANPGQQCAKPFAAAANCKPWQLLPILVYVLTLVRLVVADDTPSCSTRGAVTGHVTSNATNYRTFNASLSTCRADRSDHDSHYEQRNERFHFKSPMSQPIYKKLAAIWFLRTGAGMENGTN